MPKAKLGPYIVSYNNSDEYHRLKSEIFTHDLYYFESENPQPVIIDAGAHIGLATLYFKKLFPAAKIIAIEPHPVNFALFEENIWANGLENVETHQVALADKAGMVPFYSDASDEGWFSTAGFSKGAWNGQQVSQESQVEAAPLSDFLQEPIDLLKLDIEGAEWHVLKAAADSLHNVKNILMEFHPTPHQSLERMTKWLAEQGFKVTLWQNQRQIPVATEGLLLIQAEKM